MCLVVPLRVKSIKNGQCVMETGRVVKSLVKDVGIGDYLICRQDLGIEKVTKNKAQLIRDALKQGI